MTPWIIHPSYHHQLRQAWSATVDAEKLAAHELSAAEPVDVVDGVARIEIKGVLLNERHRVLDWFGIAQTSYADIAAQVREAKDTSSIRAIELQIDSGGGQASNMLVETAELIASSTKPVTAVVGDMAASAAYWLAAQADEIVLSGAATMVGSIGVAVDMFVADEKISIASTNAPRKRPDVRTDAGRAIVRKELDDFHELFVAAVARGRGVTADKVNREFGEGGVVLAAEAIQVGMADRVLSAGPPVPERVTLARMDLETLRKDHPGVFAAAVQTERDRVAAHLKLGEGSGDMTSAVGYIREGRGVDDLVIATHQAASMQAVQNKARVNAQAPELTSAAPPSASAASALEADVLATFALTQ